MFSPVIVYQLETTLRHLAVVYRPSATSSCSRESAPTAVFVTRSADKSVVPPPASHTSSTSRSSISLVQSSHRYPAHMMESNLDHQACTYAEYTRSFGRRVNCSCLGLGQTNSHRMARIDRAAKASLPNNGAKFFNCWVRRPGGRDTENELDPRGLPSHRQLGRQLEFDVLVQ